jgi:hypothetical protein
MNINIVLPDNESAVNTSLLSGEIRQGTKKQRKLAEIILHRKWLSVLQNKMANLNILNTGVIFSLCME